MKKRKVKWKNVILLLLFIFFTILTLFSLYNGVKWILDKKNIDKQIKDINEIVEIMEVQDNEETYVIEQNIIDEANPYWDYIKMNLIDVDFKKLKKINSETVGWIKVNGTNINYPFVQGINNSYYLSHSFDKSYNGAGWVFLDYRNKINSLDKNTIIYAHGRTDKTMFGSLKKILTNGWLNNTNNYVVKLSTETENTLWQIFSIYRIPTTNDYIQVKFSSNNEFLKFTNKLLNRSVHNFNTTLNENDKILTLSTCYNDTDKVVTHKSINDSCLTLKI